MLTRTTTAATNAGQKAQRPPDRLDPACGRQKTDTRIIGMSRTTFESAIRTRYKPDKGALIRLVWYYPLAFLKGLERKNRKNFEMVKVSSHLRLSKTSLFIVVQKLDLSNSTNCRGHSGYSYPCWKKPSTHTHTHRLTAAKSYSGKIKL